MCEFINNNTVNVSRKLSELDNFVLDFIDVIKKHCKYVIVSGYVSILFGRSRVTEDIDMIIPKLTKQEFKILYDDLLDKGFEIVNVDNLEELYDLLNTKHSIRFSYKNKVIPNMEIKFAQNSLQQQLLDTNLTVLAGNKKIQVSPLEIQIAFKENLLGSEKDKEDAKHLEIMFKKDLDPEKLKMYRRMLK